MPKFVIIWVVAFCISGLLGAYATFGTSVDYQQCRSSYGYTIGASSRDRTSNCIYWEKWKQHPTLMLTSIGILIVGGLIGAALWLREGGSYRALIDRHSTMQAAMEEQFVREAEASLRNVPSRMPAFVSASVPELTLNADILDASGHTWWLEVPFTEPSRVRISWNTRQHLRILVGQQGGWVHDLGVISANPHEVQLQLPAPNTCIYIVPTTEAPGQTLSVEVQIDLPGNVTTAREIA